MLTDPAKMVALAIDGNREALESLIKLIQKRIYNLALKMLYQPYDAEDATQEILIKVVTRLDSFRQESRFDTWALAIASNHLLNKRKSLNRHNYTFQNCENMIDRDAGSKRIDPHPKADQELILEEMRVSCMQGLLQCLDWEHRIVFILGVSMDITGSEGSMILGIAQPTFRKRLSRSRKKLRDFLSQNCELFRDSNPCKCMGQALTAIKTNYMNPEKLKYAGNSETSLNHEATAEQIRVMDSLTREANLMRYSTDYNSSDTFVNGIREMLDSGKFNKLRSVSQN